MVERWIEVPCVVGSLPTITTYVTVTDGSSVHLFNEKEKEKESNDEYTT